MNRLSRRTGTTASILALAWALAGGVMATSARSSFVSANTAASKASCPGGYITIDDFAPFSGADADFGAVTQLPGAIAAVHLLNEEGGVLGCKIKLVHTDSRGEPADAVPALNQMVATTHNLALVIGPTGDEVESVSPILNRDKLVEMNQAGDINLDHQYLKYNFRVTQSDSLIARAMGAIAILKGYRHGAMVFSSDIAGQGLVPGTISAFEKGGGSVAINVPLQQDQPSYRSTLLTIKASHADVMFNEVQARTAGAFFSQMKQLGLTHMPIITTDNAIVPDWNKAVRAGAGAAFLVHNFITLQGKVVHTPATTVFVKAYQQVYPHKQPYQLYNAQTYDSIVIAALAMTKAGSWHSQDYVNDILSITNNNHATRVYTYTRGRSLLKHHKAIQFIGASGSLVFDHWHSIGGAYQVDRWSAKGVVHPVQILSAATLRKFGP